MNKHKYFKRSKAIGSKCIRKYSMCRRNIQLNSAVLSGLVHSADLHFVFRHARFNLFDRNRNRRESVENFFPIATPFSRN